MTNIIWIGNSFFSQALERPGVSLCLLDCKPGEFLDWPGICEQAAAQGFSNRPDVVLVADKSLPPFVLGLEDFPCLTALYVVDSHLHSWFPAYAQAFDLCLVSLKDDMPNFSGKRLAPEQIVWCPPFLNPEPISPDSPDAAKAPKAPEAAAATEKLYDLLFVGTADLRVNPERVAFLEEFKGLEPRLRYMRGSYRQLYPQARLVLNHSIAGDLNFRVFEALGCGAALLTPRIGHGLEDLFTDGEDLFLFEQKDIPAAVAKVTDLLARPELLRQAARSGFAKVVSRHLAVNRGDSFLELTQSWLSNGTARQMITDRLAQSASIRKDYLKLIYLLLADNWGEFPILRSAYLAAATKSD